MLKIYFMMGLPGSGKTTRAREMLAENPNGIKRVSKDDLRAMLDGGKWSGDAEKFILKCRDLLIQAALAAKKHVIVDDTNLHPRHLERIAQLARGLAEVEVVDFTNVPIEDCIARDLKRPDSVGPQVIWRMYWQFPHKPAESPSQDLSLPEIVICDIDGTLAHANGRSPYEFEKADSDVRNDAVYDVLSNYDRVIFVTGREEKYRELTEAWLERQKVYNWVQLFMRPTGDTRRDDVVKKEIYETKIKNRYRVLFVLDDRDRTVALWRSKGLPCFQVNYGTF